MNQDAGTSGDSTESRGVPIPPRHWLPADRKEALFSFALVALFVLAYIVLHYELREKYLKHIGANIANSVMMYGIQAHEKTGELVLSLADKPFSMADEEPGPLGIGDLAATRGWLIQSSSVVENYNARLKAYVERLSAQFDFSRNRPNFVIADLSSIAPRWHQGRSKECDDADGSKEPDGATDCIRIFRIRAPHESIYGLRHRYPNERTAEALVSIIRGSTVEQVETRQDARPYRPETEPAASATDAAPATEAAAPATEAAASATETEASATETEAVSGKIAHEICENLNRMQSGVRALFYRAQKPPQTTDDARKVRVSTCKEFQPFFLYSDTTDPLTPTKSIDDGNNDQKHIACPSDTLNSRFHCRLAQIVRDNTGFFWTGGKFLWFEIILLSLVGLGVSRLVNLCKQYMRDEPFVWQHNGLWQTLLLVPVTPIIALIIIWILSITDLLSIKPVLGHTWTSAAIPIAFLLGLFPHLGYDILQGLAKGVFNRPLRGWQARTKGVVQHPIQEPEESVRSGDDGPSLDRLAAVIRQRFTAPFR